MTDVEIRSIAADFWALAGGAPAFPRNLEPSLLWALPVAVIKAPRLRTQFVRDWLGDAMHEIIPAPDRELRGCVVASRGRGLVFIDGADGEDEQRLSLAHEVAHFLLDYWLPRERALQALGESILPVLDGDRPANPEERLSAVLRGVHIGVYSRLWHRGPQGLAVDYGTIAREDAADVLAIELLAPRREVASRVRKLGEDAGADTVVEMLQSQFGLPASTARAFAGVALDWAKPSRDIRAWLGMKGTKPCRTSEPGAEQT